eukprot:CAMPEP_0175013844 /NCGR_PEP_ID=MMETSP0005-20121125/10165_1 /TAXON_ID=420556 /ORGANISM="Ochromonas sp., Strain CCMP1393" /LENGTH=483 /DNA_ID=CAMNT_0016270387 /DNA_START=17 /DNA_END=1468 /DNA_ORIENTATION=+
MGYMIVRFVVLVWLTSRSAAFKPVNRLFWPVSQVVRHATTADNDQVDIPVTKKLTNLLTDLWGAVAFPDGETDFLLEDYGLNREQVRGFIDHFQSCKDCAGDSAFLMATQNNDDKDIFKLTPVAFTLLTDDGDDDGWGDWGESELVQRAELEKRDVEPIFPIENDDDIIIADTKKWVQKVIADFAICPFTIDPNKGGIPMGGVRYSVSRAKDPEEAFLRYWEEVKLTLEVPEKQVSTVLLVFPELELFGNYELFESYCECLQDALSKSAINLETEVQLVFFHPRFQFRDGKERSGESESAPNYARRSPWPMVNILRTNQVRAAQKGVPTGVVYQQNEERLNEVGAETLQRMLYTRDWTGLPMHTTSSKAIRRNIEEAKSKGEQVNLLDPILTSRSQDKWTRCPVQHSSDEGMSHAEKEDAVAAATVDGKCPVDHDGTNVAAGTAASVTEDQQNEEAEDAGDGGDEIDYLKLADDVDAWLADQY